MWVMCLNKQRTMASHQQKRDLSKTARQPRAGTMTAASSTASTSIVGSSQVDSVLPYTTFVTATLTDSIPLQQPTSTPALSHSLQLSSNSSLHASASSSHKSSASIHHVPSEADVPEKWGPKDLDVEKHRQYKFMGGIALICVITVVGIIGIGWWR
jgi:hypothetical protein